MHIALPVYAVAAALVLLLSSHPLSVAEGLRLALMTGAWFIPLYAILIIVVSVATSAAGRLVRRRRAISAARDPAVAAKASAQRLAAALPRIEAIAAGNEETAFRIRTAVAQLRSGVWRHEDKRFQAVSSDLAMATAAFAASFDTAGVKRQSEIRLMAATALEQIAGELRRLQSENTSLDCGDAQVAARYIDLRYGGTDFTGDLLP